MKARQEVINKFGSVAALSRRAGKEFFQVRQLVIDAETDPKKLTQLRAMMRESEKDRVFSRLELRSFFKHRMQFDYKKLHEAVQKELPHITIKRLRHYLGINQAPRATCKTYKAICRALELE